MCASDHNPGTLCAMSDALRTSREPTPDGPDVRPAAGIGDETSVSGTSKVVAARLRYIERQARLDPSAFDVGRVAGFVGRAPEGQGPPNRHGRPKLPVGQREVRNWPVLDLGDQPDVARGDWSLTVGGLVHDARTFSFDELSALPRTELVVDFHCVTTWSRMDLPVAGVRLRDLLAEVVPSDDAHFVSFTGHDVLPGTDVPYTTNLPLARATEEDVMVVYEALGAPLAREHGGPVRVIVPRLYAWKGTKWLRGIELLAEDRPGFWETRGYSNSAEPWFNDRYSS
jgi:DMSO/TMAO reductase YedYZ molybdopterin-dependent catalytic subunit